MFEVSWSELLIVGIVALLVVGPKEMPTLLRTVGKYVGMIKRQAAEFRAQFDEAMREAELDQLKKEVDSIKSDAEGALRQAEASVTKEVDDARRTLDDAAAASALAEPDLHDANGLPVNAAEAAFNGHEGPPPASAAAKRPDGTVEPKTPV